MTKLFFFIMTALIFSCQSGKKNNDIENSAGIESRNADSIPKLDHSEVQDVLSKTGTTIKQEFFRTGQTNNFYIDAVKLTNLNTDSTVKGIRIRAGVPTLPGGSGYIDQDEIKGLLGYLQKMEETEKTKAPEALEDYSFKSRSGFEAYLLGNKGKWTFGIKADKNIATSYTSFQNVEMFYKMVDSANNIIKSKP